MVLSLGASGRPALRTTGGKLVKQLAPGAYKVSVRDRSAKRGVRLAGAGAAKSDDEALPRDDVVVAEASRGDAPRHGDAVSRSARHRHRRLTQNAVCLGASDLRPASASRPYSTRPATSHVAPCEATLSISDRRRSTVTRPGRPSPSIRSKHRLAIAGETP